MASTLFETLGYRQLNSIWRIRAFFGFVRGEHSWGKMNRTGLNNEVNENGLKDQGAA